MDIYELINDHRASPWRSRRVVAAIMDDLNDRRGIKQELQGCDEEVIKEIFDSLTHLVSETQ